MKRAVLIVLSLAIIGVLHAGWERTYGGDGSDAGYCVQRTTDGGYVITGSTGSFGSGESDLWLLKTDSMGDTVWTRTYGGNNRDWGSEVRQTFDAGYIILGETFAVDSEPALTWILRTDSLGDTLWTQTYEGGGSWGEESNWIEQTRDSCYIITGRKSGNLWLVKLNSSGEIIWKKTYGGDEHDEGYCVQETSDNGYIITGRTKKIDEFGGLWLLKTDSVGDTVWTTTGGWEGPDCGLVVRERESGNFSISSYKEMPGLSAALWLFFTYNDGYIPHPGYYWPGLHPIEGNCMCITPDEYTAVLGSDSAQIPMLIKSQHDNVQWARTLGGDEIDVRGLDNAGDEGFIIVGYLSYPNGDGCDLWLAKTDSLGYIGIEEEPPVTPVTHHSNWKVANPVGSEIILRYTNRPQGFSAAVFNASGRKVDELHLSQSSGTLQWGECYGPGVYFIRDESDSPTTHKVVLVR